MFALKTNKKKKKNRKKAQTKKDKNFDRAAQGGGRNHLFSRCACVITIYFVLVCTRTYHRERNKILEMAPTLPQERVRNWQICTVPWHAWRYHMEKITRTLLYIYRNCYLLLIELSEWKGTVTCGRGRNFSPSLPGDRYLRFSWQKRSPGRNFGEHRLVRRSGTASIGS